MKRLLISLGIALALVALIFFSFKMRSSERSEDLLPPQSQSSKVEVKILGHRVAISSEGELARGDLI